MRSAALAPLTITLLTACVDDPLLAPRPPQPSATAMMDRASLTLVPNHAALRVIDSLIANRPEHLLLIVDGTITRRALADVPRRLIRDVEVIRNVRGCYSDAVFDVVLVRLFGVERGGAR